MSFKVIKKCLTWKKEFCRSVIREGGEGERREGGRGGGEHPYPVLLLSYTSIHRSQKSRK